MSYIIKQIKLDKEKIDLEKNKIITKFDQELNITINRNGLNNDVYEYKYEVSKEYSNSFYLMVSRDSFIQFSSFQKEYLRAYDNHITYKGNGGVKFTDPINLFELKYSKSHFNDWETPLEGQLLIKENLIKIIENIKTNKINLLPMYNLILEQINYYMETEEKPNNYNSSAMKKSNIFDFFPMIINKEDKIQWYIPNFLGEDIYIPFDGNLPILNNRIENILTEDFEQNNRSNNREIHLSYSLFSNIGIELNTFLYSKENDIINIEQVIYNLNENNNYINERKIKKYGKDNILTQLSHEIGNNDIIPMYTVTRTVIDIEETKKLLNYLDSNIKIEEIIEIANKITENEDITLANKKAKYSHYPYISKEIRIDKDSVETYINHKLNVFIPEDSKVNTFNKTKENVFVSVNIKEKALDNIIKIKTYDGEELILIEKEINELNLNQNIFQTKIYIPINKNSLLVDFIIKLDNNSRFEFVAYKNIVFTNIKNKISIPQSIIEETSTKELLIDKIYKNKDIENLNSFYISTHCFSDNIEKTQVSKNYEPNKIFLYDRKEKKIILIDMLLKKEVIFENQNNNLFLYENNTIIKSNSDLNQDFFILEDRIVMFKMDIDKERMTYQFENLKEDSNKPFEIIEIIKNNQNTVTIPIFIPVEDTPRNFKLSENKEFKSNESYSKTINRKKEINENGNLKVTNYILREPQTYEEFEKTIKLENFFINGEERDIDIYSTTKKELFKNEVILITINLDKFNKYRNNIKIFETIMENNKIHSRHQPKFEDIFKKTISTIRNYKTIIEEPNKVESLIETESIDNQIENEILDNQIENNLQNKFIEKIEIPFLNVKYEKDVAFDFYSLLFKNTIKRFQFSKNKDNNVIAQISIMGNRNFDLELELITLNNSVNIMISDINDNSNNLTLIDIIKTIKKGKIDIIEKENKDIIINNNSELIYIRKDNFIDDNYMVLNHNTKFKKDIQMIDFDKKLTKTIGETSILEKNGEYFLSKNGVKFYLDKSNKEIEQKIFIENFLLKENLKKNHTINLNF